MISKEGIKNYVIVRLDIWNNGISSVFTEILIFVRVTRLSSATQIFKVRRILDS